MCRLVMGQSVRDRCQQHLFVCLFVCQHDNFRTKKHRMMKLGVDAMYKISAEFEFVGHSPLGCALPKCGVRLQRWENQRRLSSFCYAYFYYFLSIRYDNASYA